MNKEQDNQNNWKSKTPLELQETERRNERLLSAQIIIEAKGFENYMKRWQCCNIEMTCEKAISTISTLAQS